MAAVGPIGRIARMHSSIYRNHRLFFNRGPQRRGIASCIDRKSQKTRTVSFKGSSHDGCVLGNI